MTTEIDFSFARRKHLEWKAKLRLFLDGKGTLTESEAVSHHDCALGRWYYGAGKNVSHLAEMQAMEAPHAELHSLVKKIIQLKNAGQTKEAETLFQKMEPLSKQIVRLLNGVEWRLKTKNVSIFHKLSISSKIVLYIALVIAIFLSVGIANYLSVDQIRNDMLGTRQRVGLVEGASEMRLAMAQEMQMVMELLAAKESDSFAEIWKEHTLLSQSFNLYANAILQGGETPRGRVIASKNDKLRTVVTDAASSYNNDFLARMQRIEQLRKQEFSLQPQKDSLLLKTGTETQRIGQRVEALENQARELFAIFQTGSPPEHSAVWQRKLLEIQSGLVLLEEYLHKSVIDEGTLSSYKEVIQQLDAAVVSFQQGKVLQLFKHEENSSAMTVIPMPLPDQAVNHFNTLREAIHQVEQDQLALYESRRDLEKIGKEFTSIRDQLDEVDHIADVIGEKLLEKLVEVDNITKKTMNTMAESSQHTADQFVRVLMVGFTVAVVFSLGTGLFLARHMVQPLEKLAEEANQLAEGDLTVNIEVTSFGETGKLQTAIKNMLEMWQGIIAEIHQGSMQIDTSSREISSANLALSQRTEEQAASLEQTAASTEELTATVKQNAVRIRETSQLTQSATLEAEQSGEMVRQTVRAMDAVHRSSKKIVDIISLIDEIAFQTNLLALNAAVEAARAGEQGRGFTVVAAEVRKLAQRSADAAKEIKELIRDTEGKVDEGYRLVNASGNKLNEIVDSVRHINHIVIEMSHAIQEQSVSVDQVAKVIGQIDNTTQQNAAMVEETASASQALAAQAYQMELLTELFKLRKA